MTAIDSHPHHRNGTAPPKRKPGVTFAKLESLYRAPPPHALEAERALLGSLLIDPHRLPDVMLLITADDFQSPDNGALFGVMVECYEGNSAMDLVMLSQILADRKILNTPDWQSWLVNLANDCPAGAHATYYAKQVREKSVVRRLITSCAETLEDIDDDPGDASGLLDRAEQRVSAIATNSAAAHETNLAALVQNILDGENQVTGTLSGFASLDMILDGFRPGDVVIVAARPSMGKTAIAMNIAAKIAAHTPVGVISIEMTNEQLVHRLIASESGVSLHSLRKKNLTSEQMPRLHKGCEFLRNAPLFIAEMRGAITPMTIRAQARRMVHAHGVKVLVIDYLQLIDPGKRFENRNVEVGYISRQIKQTAQDLGIAIILVSQLSRGTESREDHRPRLSDLRDSGNIEQDADIVMFVHREDYYRQQRGAEHELDGLADVIVAKNRNGAVGSTQLRWNPACVRFSDLERVIPARRDGGSFQTEFDA